MKISINGYPCNIGDAAINYILDLYKDSFKKEFATESQDSVRYVLNNNLNEIKSGEKPILINICENTNENEDDEDDEDELNIMFENSDQQIMHLKKCLFEKKYDEAIFRLGSLGQFLYNCKEKYGQED